MLRVDTDVLTEVSMALEAEREKLSTKKLQAALALYRGDFLSGIKVRGEEELDAWLEHRRMDYRRHALHICQALVSRLREAGEPDEAVRVARRGIAIDADDEAMHVALLRALKDAGQTTGARIESDRFIAHLREVLEVEPSEVLQALRQTLPQTTAPGKDPTTSRERRWSAVVLRAEQRGLGSASALRLARTDLAELAAQVASQGRAYKLTAGADGLETLTFGYPCADADALIQALDAAHRLMAERDDLAIAIEQGCIADDMEPTDNPVGDVFPITHALLARCSAGEILVGERAASAVRPYYRLTKQQTLRTRTRPSIRLTYWASQGRHLVGEASCCATPADPKAGARHQESASAHAGLILQGAMGAGKTHRLNRLLAPASENAQAPRLLQCLPGDRLRPLGAFARWLRACMGSTTPATELPVRRALVRHLGERRETLEAIEPLTVTLLTELILRNERLRLGRSEFDAETLASRLAPVFLVLFAADNGGLLVDNVDEADALTLGWLNQWIQGAGDTGHFVMTCRELPEALVLPESTRVERLRKLSTLDSRRLVTQVCGHDVIGKEAMARLLGLAADNPGRLVALAEWHQHRSQGSMAAGKELPPSLLSRIGGRMGPADGPMGRLKDPLESWVWSHLFGDSEETGCSGQSASEADALPARSEATVPLPTLLASR
ncbi:BTAD domain-containing putative transcriptional regulator [Spiribacter roseus]|uniref:Bacterial transcriptional activator domain-containing protein n=1 Tax=Spiribacter roseus TaxID=1855875 RepID=A0ABV3RZT3_9GAMM